VVEPGRAGERIAAQDDLKLIRPPMSAGQATTIVAAAAH
jgi:hypothetical protein